MKTVNSTWGIIFVFSIGSLFLPTFARGYTADCNKAFAKKFELTHQDKNLISISCPSTGDLIIASTPNGINSRECLFRDSQDKTSMACKVVLAVTYTKGFGSANADCEIQSHQVIDYSSQRCLALFFAFEKQEGLY